jgi:hypothetical protein
VIRTSLQTSPGRTGFFGQQPPQMASIERPGELVPAAGLESARVRLQCGCSPSELCGHGAGRPLRYECTALPLRHAGNEIHKRPVRARPIEKSSLPETTVCRSTKGDQYRISGPSYVLAGTAILNSNHVMQTFAARGCPPASIGSGNRDRPCGPEP